MSRIGRKPIDIPAGVTVTIDGNVVTAKGPKGELTKEMPSAMDITIDGAIINVTRPDDSRQNRSLHGLTRSLVFNLVDGVINGYSKVLEVNGVGYRVQMQGKDLVMSLGYSHQVIVNGEPGIDIEVNGNKITILGADKQRVGQFAAEVRAKRPPEPYKGKGIKYIDEVIIRKEGKTAK